MKTPSAEPGRKVRKKSKTDLPKKVRKNLKPTYLVWIVCGQEDGHAGVDAFAPA